MSGVRRWLGLGPSRSELVAEARLWRERCERKNAQIMAAHARAKDAERQVRELRAEVAGAQERISSVLALRLTEPDRVDGCAKIRFIRQEEAADFRETLSSASGEPIGALDVYRCKICPLSPVTMLRHWHVGHGRSREAQEAKAAGRAQRGSERAGARAAGLLIEQRVDATVAAKLREIQRSR